MRANKKDYIKAGLLITVILVVMCMGGCFQQKTSVTVLDAQNRPVQIKSTSTSALKDMQVVYKPDPNDPTKMTLKVEGGSSKPMDVLMAGLGVLVGLFL